MKEFEKIIAVICTRMSFFELFLTTAFPGSYYRKIGRNGGL